MAQHQSRLEGAGSNEANAQDAQQKVIGGKRLATIVGAIFAIVCVANLISQPIRALTDPFETDFAASFRVAALMLHSGDHQIYCIPCFSSFIYQIYGMHPIEFWVFSSAPLVALALIPFAQLDLVVGLAAFLAVSLLALAIASKWLARLAGPQRNYWLLIMVVASLPAAQALALGQVDPFIFLAVVGALVAAKANRWWIAGIMFGMALAKPQYVWLTPFALLALGQWRALMAMAVVGVGWVATSLAIVGSSGLHAMVSAASITASNEVSRAAGVTGLAYLLTGSQTIATVVGVTCGVALGASLIYFRKSFLEQPWALIALAILVSLATAPHIVPYSLLGAAPAMILWGQKNMHAALWAAIALNLAYLIDLLLPPHTSYAESVWIVSATGILLWSILRPGRVLSSQNA